MITEPGIYLDVPESAYHADPCPAPSLSSSIAKELIERSPLHAWQLHPKLGGGSRTATAAQDHGSLVHELLLGRGRGLAIVEANDWRTKAAKLAKAEAQAQGLTPVLARKHAIANTACAKIRARLSAQGVELAGESEVTVVWREQTPHGEIWARARFDHLEGATIVDLKTTERATKSACERQIIAMGYDIQRAAYVRALTTIRPELGGRVRFLFAFIETEPPYGVMVADVDSVLRTFGDRRWVDAVDRWAWALQSEHWHGYAPVPQFEAPGWLLARMEEA